jgi:hypothetical protein
MLSVVGDIHAHVQNPQGDRQIKYTPQVGIPLFIIDQLSQMEDMANQYWDNFDFNDATLMHDADCTKQGYVNFITFLIFQPPLFKERTEVNT